MTKSTFKKIKDRENKFGQDCSRQLYAFIKKNPEKYPSSLKELMSICGLECDFESVRTYQQFHLFLQRHRKYTDELFAVLIMDGWFDKYKAEGLSDDDIYSKFIETCISYEIIPLYFDVDGLYKIIDLHSFLLIKKERFLSAATEIKHKTDSYRTMEQILPDTIHSEMEMLKSSPDVKKLIDTRNELNRLLPKGEEDEEEKIEEGKEDSIKEK